MNPHRSASLRLEHRHLAKYRGLIVQVGRELLQKVEPSDRTRRIRRAFITVCGPDERHDVANRALVTSTFQRELAGMFARKTLQVIPGFRRMRDLDAIVDHRLPHQPVWNEI